MKLDKHILQATKLSPNSTRALLHYTGAFENPAANDIETHFQKNGWNPQWRYPMYKQAHYHSTTHEALGVFEGAARLRFGVSDHESEHGLELDVQAGDVLVIPAGVMHRAITDKDGFCMVGAYPQNANPWDMNYGSSEKECQDKLATIKTVQDPAKDPFTGQGIWGEKTPGKI